MDATSEGCGKRGSPRHAEWSDESGRGVRSPFLLMSHAAKPSGAAGCGAEGQLC